LAAAHRRQSLPWARRLNVSLNIEIWQEDVHRMIINEKKMGKIAHPRLIAWLSKFRFLKSL